jgi:transposase
MLGLLIGSGGWPIGYRIFEGNTFDGKTLLPVLKEIQKKYRFDKPVVVADAPMLSKKNLNALDRAKYPFIAASRIRNESDVRQKEILERSEGLQDGQLIEVELGESMIEQDARWDGLKGYLTSTDLSPTEVIDN